MKKEEIKVYNLAVVELEGRELSKSEAEIALNDAFVNSIANITENVMEKLKSMCLVSPNNEVKFGLRTNEDNTVYRVAIKVACEENTTTKLALIKDLISSLVSITEIFISSCDAYKKELNDMLNEYSKNETRESDSQFEETK